VWHGVAGFGKIWHRLATDGMVLPLTWALGFPFGEQF
jgi:hypothetical protein